MSYDPVTKAITVPDGWGMDNDAKINSYNKFGAGKKNFPYERPQVCDKTI